jgi:hypothetical protein
VVPFTAAGITTTANIPDNKMYISLISSSSSLIFSLPTIGYMLLTLDIMLRNCCINIAKVLGIYLILCPSRAI